MPTMETPYQDDRAQIDLLWQQFEALHKEAMAVGTIDPKEEDALIRLSSKISELEVLAQQKMVRAKSTARHGTTAQSASKAMINIPVLWGQLTLK